MNVKKSYLKYLTSLLMFGTNGIVASYIALNSYDIVLTRTLIGSVCLIVFFAIKRRKIHLLQNKKDALFMFLSGVSMGASWMFLYEAYTKIGVSIASLAYYCGPVIVLILSPIIFHERLTWAKGAGFFFVLLGMFFVNADAVSSSKTSWGLFCGIMSAIMFAFMVIFNKKAESITGLENAMWQILTSFLTVAAFVAIKHGIIMHIELGSLIPIFILGIFNTGIGCYFYFSSIGGLPVQTVAICGYIEPLSAVIFSMIFLRESMSLIQVIGAILILGGAAFGELFDLKKNKSKV